MSDGKVQLEAELDASRVKQGAAEVTGAVRQMGREVEREAGRVSAATSKMGSGGEQAAQSTQKAERSIIASIQRQTAAYEAGGRSTREYYEAIARQRGIGADVLKPYLDQLDAAVAKQTAASASMGQMGMSAQQTAAAMRMVPMQVTDIVVGLASGQKPMMVLLQQGGQLKDVFGGVGAAVRGLATYVAGLVNPLTVVLGVAGAVAAAYAQGSKELDGYNKALALSGNISGTTAASMQEMARAMAEGSRTQSASAAALAEMATSSQVGAEYLQRYTAIAVDWERVTGNAVSKTAEAFKSLEQEPLKASLKLNDGLNFLTMSTYEHIRSLEQQGKKTDAARVAQEAYAESLASRTRQVTQNLGYIERGWNAVTGAAKRAWDAMLNAGRASTQADKISSIDRELADLQSRNNAGFSSNGGGAAFGRPDAAAQSRVQARIQALQAEKAAIAGVMDAEKKRAEQQAADARRVEAKAAWDAEGIKYLSKSAQMEREIALARNEGKAAGVEVAEIEKRIGDIRAQYAEKGGSASRARSAAMKAERAEAKQLADDLSNLAQSAGLSPSFYKEWEQLNDMFRRGKLDVQGLTQAQAALLEKQPAIRAETQAQAKAHEELVRAIDERRKAELELIKEEARRVDSIAGGNEKLREEIELIGLTAEQQTALTIAKNQSTIAAKEEQLARMQSSTLYTREQAMLEEEIKLLRERNELLGNKQLREAQEASNRAMREEAQKTADSINQSLTDALLRGFEGGKDFAKNFKDTLVNMFKTLVLRPVISFIVQPIGNAISGIVSGFLGGGQGGAGGILGGATNGNSILNFGSLISNWMGAGSGAAAGTLAYGNMIGALGGDGLGAFMAANGGWGTSGFGAVGSSLGGIGGSAVGLGVVAAPLVIGALAERNSRDRYGGAAYATSDWRNDPMAATIGADFDGLTGSLPDRAALEERARQAGIADATMAMFGGNDRAFLHYVRLAEGGGIGENGILPDPRKLIEESNLYGADFYRGAGYASPEAMGWWNDKHSDLLSNDPKVAAASRALSESIVAPLTDLARMMGDEADLRVTTGFANRGEGAMWGAARIERGGQTIMDMERGDYADAQQYMRAVYRASLGALEELDLPAWAGKLVTDTQTQLDALSGDKVGEQAAAIYTQAADGIRQMYGQIKTLIDVFPDFAGATQDSVYALQALMGGMDNLQAAYSSYIGAFWTEQERTALTTAQLTAQLAELGQTMPTTREQFRAMVEQAMAAGEEGNTLAAALLGMSGAMAEVLPQIDAITTVAFEASGELAGLIKDGLLGTFDGTNLGAAMAQTVSDGIYNAIAGGFAQQITDIIVQGVVQPVIAAAMTGSSVSAAVSAASIESMVAQAQAVAQAAAAVLNDPAIRDAIGSISSAVASISVPAMSAAPQYVRSYTAAVRDSGNAAETAAREAESLADAWRGIGDTLIDEVNRIRGVVADAGGDSLSYYQSLFAMDTAAARAGDQEAAGRLTGLSGDLLRAAEAQAGSLFELQQMRAWVAQSLQDTAGYAYAKAGVTTPSVTPATVTAQPPAMFALRTAQQDNGTRELNQQIAVLTEQNQRQAAQLADLQLQLLRVFRRWDDEGMPPQREEDGVTA